MADKKEYEISLKDLFTPKIEEAKEAADKFTESLDGIKEMAGKVAEALNIPFGTDKILEFAKKSDELFESLEKANAQIAAGLERTHNAAGLTMKELKDQQNAFGEKVDYSSAALANMQATLLTFPAVTQKAFGGAEQAVLDMAASQQTDLKATAQQVGKALQDPAKGIEALNSAGVYFNQTQTEMVKKLVATGQAGQAQLVILKQLEAQFGGSAEAVAKTNPFFEYDNAMADFQVDIGETIHQLKEVLAPTLTAMAKDFKTVFDWGVKHKELIIALTSAYAFYNARQMILNAITVIGTKFKLAQAAATSGLTVKELENGLAKEFITAEEIAQQAATSELTIAQWALNTAMEAFPGVALAALIGLAVAGIYKAITASGEAKAQYEDYINLKEEQGEIEKKAHASGADAIAQMHAQLALVKFYKQHMDAAAEKTKDHIYYHQQLNEAWGKLIDLGGGFTSILDKNVINIDAATSATNRLGSALTDAARIAAAMSMVTDNDKKYYETELAVSASKFANTKDAIVYSDEHLNDLFKQINLPDTEANRRLAMKDVFNQAYTYGGSNPYGGMQTYTINASRAGKDYVADVQKLARDALAEMKTETDDTNNKILDISGDASKKLDGMNLTKNEKKTLVGNSTEGTGGLGDMATGNSNTAPHGMPVSGTETSGATGNKSTTINIHIDKQIDKVEIHSTTIEGSTQKIKEALTRALAAAINDSQRLAHD